MFSNAVNKYIGHVKWVQFQFCQQLKYFRSQFQKLKRTFIDEMEAYRFELATSTEKAEQNLAAKFKGFKY